MIRTLEDTIKLHILEAYMAAERNCCLAAKNLGIGRTTVWRRINEWELRDKSPAYIQSVIERLKIAN